MPAAAEAPEAPPLKWPPIIFFDNSDKRPPGLAVPPPLRTPAQPEPVSLEDAFTRVWEAPDPGTLHWRVWRPIQTDGAGFVKLLHQKWENGAGPREHVSTVLSAFILNASGSSLHSDLEGKWNSPTRLDIDWLLPLLDDTFALGGNHVDHLLYATGRTRTLAANEQTRLVFLSRLKDVPPGNAAKWGLALRTFSDSATAYRADLCRCYHAAYDELLQSEKNGLLVIKPSIAFGQGAYSETASLRDAMVSAARSNACRETASLTARVIEAELDHRQEILTSARFCIQVLDPTWPETIDALGAALRRNHAWLNLAALDYMRDHDVDTSSLLDDVRRLASASRRDVSERAGDVLQSRGLEVPATPPFRLDGTIAERLLALCPFDLRGGRRFTIPTNRPEVSIPGWLLPHGGEFLFISDELVYSFGTPESLFATELDFATELAGVPEQVRSRRIAKDDFRSPPGAGLWVVGHEIHDFLRLLYAVAWERASGNMDYPLASPLYAELIQECSSQADMEARIAYNLSWLRVLRCINAFGRDDDDVAGMHAEGIRQYAPWARPQTDMAHWQSQAVAIEREIVLRQAGYTTTDVQSIEYWIERLPEVHVGQFMQPGGAVIVQDKLAVAAHIYGYGLDAVWPLVSALDNHDRLVRGCGYWRDFARSRTLFTTGQIAGWILSSILHEELGCDIGGDYFLPANRNILHAWLEQALSLASQRG